MWLYRLNARLGPVIGVYWRLGLAGAVDTIPNAGPLLVASNHASFLDPWFIGMAFPRHLRYLINRDWYYRSRAWQALFQAFGTEPVRPGPGETIDAVCRLLSRGEAVGVFPEGKISRDGRIQGFHSGIARMAARSGAPVIPVGIRGNFSAFPRHRRVPAPARVTIHVGAPMRFAGPPARDLPPACDLSGFKKRLFETICALAGQSDHPAPVAPAAARRGRGERALLSSGPASGAGV